MTESQVDSGTRLPQGDIRREEPDESNVSEQSSSLPSSKVAQPDEMPDSILKNSLEARKRTKTGCLSG